MLSKMFLPIFHGCFQAEKTISQHLCFIRLKMRDDAPIDVGEIRRFYKFVRVIFNRANERLIPATE